MTELHALTVGLEAVERALRRPSHPHVANPIVESAHRLARSAVHSINRVLPWLNGAREVREEIASAFARHFERQLEEEQALCLHCGSARVNYCERDGHTGVGLDGHFETASEAGYLCADCGAFEDGVIQIESEEGA
jgi:hypothetical protein